jgi:predicted Fe-Mo cluster-binding NifX family protein
MGTPVDILLKYKPDIVFAIGIGPRAAELLKSYNIRIETGDFQTVREIIENKDKLKQLEEFVNIVEGILFHKSFISFFPLL